ELKGENRLSLSKSLAHDLRAHIPGFDPFKESFFGHGVHRDAIRAKLTQNLGKVTESLSKETSDALSDLFTDNPDWHEVLPKQLILRVIIRVSALILLGPEASRNADYCRVTVQYAVNMMLASQALRSWPRFLQPLVHWFLPSCRRLRALMREARNIIQPLVDKKRTGDISGRPSDNLVNHFTDSFRLVLASIQVLTHVTVSMRRRALEDIRLHDGLEIPKGAFIGVSTHRMWDPTIYPEPEKFDGYRFLKRSQIQGHEKDSQFAATSVDHMGFGYGNQACPGRFFAVDVIKIVFCHLLLKYDWKLQEGYKPVVLEVGVSFLMDPKTKLLVRRRQEEIPI
ncbi:hypothetical protein Egran_01545, partial [Elaphomyces granulatus]